MRKKWKMEKCHSAATSYGVLALSNVPLNWYFSVSRVKFDTIKFSGMGTNILWRGKRTLSEEFCRNLCENEDRNIFFSYLVWKIFAHMWTLIEYNKVSRKKEKRTVHSFSSCPSEQFPYLFTVIIMIRESGTYFEFYDFHKYIEFSHIYQYQILWTMRHT